MYSTMRRAAAVGVSPNRITLLRDADGDGVADTRETFLDGLNQPFGMALVGDTFYVGNTDGVVAFPYAPGASRIAGSGRTIATFKPGGHWTRSLLPSPDGTKLYVGVGSLSNIGEKGMAAEEGRAAVYEIDLASGRSRIFASGLRNPVGLAWEPRTGALWTVVNERDGLGDDLPPDYLTRVRDGAFYGWPWYYIGAHQDPRHDGEHPELRDKITIPDVLLQPHSAPLGLAVYTGTQFPRAYRNDIFVALHGSWNRARRTGYKVVRAILHDGKPTGEYEDFLTGFVTKEGDVWARPVGVAVAADGALLVSDDAGGTIWRIAYTGAR
jgi:glucose/arabinose dehydrogenase